MDGLVVVGFSSSGSGPEAFRWTKSSGMVGWVICPGGKFHSIANDVSGDGSVVVGAGVNPSGNNEAWRAVLTVPGSDQMLPKVDSERQDIPGQN